MGAMIREWLRRWLDVPERVNLGPIEDTLTDLSREIQALKYMRSQREAKALNRLVGDWDQVQAEYAADPENYKEN